MTVNNCIFSKEYSLFMKFVWFSEQAVVISLNIINQFMFVIEICVVFLVIETEFLNNISYI
jgi:hypothetical protein